MDDGSYSPGPIALLGSGETSLIGSRMIELLSRNFPAPLRISILETPAGFELNSAQVAERVADFFDSRLQNYRPVVDIIPARKRGTQYSPDDLEILKPVLQADIIFMGPGSPTYAVRQLKDSLAWDIIRARHWQGAALLFSSAAAIAIGTHLLPVYEIFKVGEDVSAPPGLGLMEQFGLQLSFIPHWNNAEGGADLDTSRCFVGMERFRAWCELLPTGHTCVGLDEHTGVVINFPSGECQVHGVSSVTLLKDCVPRICASGETFFLKDLGDFRMPGRPKKMVPRKVLDLLERTGHELPQKEKPPQAVMRLAEERQAARLRKDWVEADRIRSEIEAAGWQVQDSPDGPRFVRNK